MDVTELKSDGYGVPWGHTRNWINGYILARLANSFADPTTAEDTAMALAYFDLRSIVLFPGRQTRP